MINVNLVVYFNRLFLQLRDGVIKPILNLKKIVKHLFLTYLYQNNFSERFK